MTPAKSTVKKEYSLSADVFYKKAMEVATYYGFTSLTQLLQKENSVKEKGRDKNPWHNLCEQEKVSVMKLYVEKLMDMPPPVQFYWRHGSPSGKTERARFSLEVIGGGRSISEGLAIATARAILQEIGVEEMNVAINSLGDKDCFASFQRDLGYYLRKHASAFCNACRERAKKDLFALYECDNKHCKELLESAPRSLGHLHEEARQHFREVLEYLEGMGITYELDPHLVGSSTHCFKTVFEIRTIPKEGEKIEVLARGGRYDSLAKRLGLKREVSAVGITIERSVGPSSRKDILFRGKKTEIYFIHLGFEAKRRALELLEMLRRHNIAVMQSLSKDKLGSQLALAEKLKVSTTLIIGHKEAVEGTVIVRSMFNRSQETVPMTLLVDYLKKHRG